MFAAIADTHAVIWYLSRDPHLSQTAKDFIDKSFVQEKKIGVPAISLVEMVYLAEKGHIPPDQLAQLVDALAADGVLVEVPLDIRIAQTVAKVPRDAVPDMPDRIIAATALHLGVPLISRDRKIQLSTIETIW
jgi:PIN domain nuclease of toxin-antitoxin system